MAVKATQAVQGAAKTSSASSTSGGASASKPTIQVKTPTGTSNSQQAQTANFKASVDKAAQAPQASRAQWATQTSRSEAAAPRAAGIGGAASPGNIGGAPPASVGGSSAPANDAPVPTGVGAPKPPGPQIYPPGNGPGQQGDIARQLKQYGMLKIQSEAYDEESKSRPGMQNLETNNLSNRYDNQANALAADMSDEFSKKAKAIGGGILTQARLKPELQGRLANDDAIEQLRNVIDGPVGRAWFQDESKRDSLKAQYASGELPFL